MAGSDNRVDARATTSMRIKLKYPDVDTFIQKYAVNISRGGIFIATRQPKPTGTVVRFEFLLANAEQTSLIRGEGVVQWTRDYDPATPTKAHGMGVKFTRLDAESQAVVDRALAHRASQGMAKRDSEGITVQQVAPPGATPEPMAMPPSRDPMRAPRQPAPAPRAEEDETTQTREVPEPPRPRRRDEPLPTERSLPPVIEQGEDEHEQAPRTIRAFEDARGDGTVLQRTLRGDPTTNERPRDSAQHTRPVTVPDEPSGRLRDVATRPIQLPDAPGPAPEDSTGETRLPSPGEASPAMTPMSVDDSVRIALQRHRQPRNGGRKHGDELDQLIADWDVSTERVEALLKRKRPRIGAQATAELERLLRKPPKPAAPSKSEAVQLLDALLAGRSPMRTGPSAQAATSPSPSPSSEGEPDVEPSSPQRRRKRAR